MRLEWIDAGEALRSALDAELELNRRQLGDRVSPQPQFLHREGERRWHFHSSHGLVSLGHLLRGWCVATLQGQAGPWCSCRWKNTHGAAGMSGMPLFTGGRATHAASCVSICMSHVVAPAHQCGPCSLACVSSSSSPPAGSPHLFKY